MLSLMNNKCRFYDHLPLHRRISDSRNNLGNSVYRDRYLNWPAIENIQITVIPAKQIYTYCVISRPSLTVLISERDRNA